MSFVLACVLELAALPAQDAREPVPPDRALAEADKTIRDVFKDELSVKTGTAAQKLARKMIEQAQLTRDDAALRFSLYRSGADLAAQTGDPEILARALDGLIASFAVDAMALRQQYLSKIEPHLVRPEDFRKAGEAQLVAASEAADREQFDLAVALANSALAMSKKAKDLTLAARADAAQKSVAERREALEKSKKALAALEASPDDAAAHSAVGEYLALLQGRWEQALPHLAKGTDPALKALAEKELSGPDVSAVELGDGWWELAEKERSPARKKQLFDHAASFYDRVLPGLTGLTKVRIEKRLAARSPAVRRPAPPSQGLVAWWKFDENSGTVVQNSAGPGNTVQLMTGVGWTRGRLGSALLFQGASGYAAAKDLKLPPLGAPQTITWWVNLTSTAGATQTILCFASDAASSATQLGLRGGQFGVWKHGGSLLVMGPVPTLNAWHHGAFVFDGKRSLLYEDGKLSVTSDGGPQSGAVSRCEFGRYWGGTTGAATEYYNGLLDEVRVYDRALPEAEILELSSAKDP